MSLLLGTFGVAGLGLFALGDSTDLNGPITPAAQVGTFGVAGLGRFAFGDYVAPSSATTQAINGIANISATTTKTQSGVASLVQAHQHTITGVARITANT